jgi:SAM-dependent methyltransferase
MDQKEIYELYLKTHNKMIEANGFTEKSLWGSTQSQQLRFLILSRLFRTKKDFSILDVGCGLCDFYVYLQNNGYENISYTGLEINPLFVKEVSMRHPSLRIIEGSVDDLAAESRWDYVIASGIYNLGTSVESTQDFFIQQFEKLFPKIDIGFAVNFLSAFSKNKDDVSMYHQPSVILEKSMLHFSPHTQLHHDYLPHDFTLLVYKNQQQYL